MQSYDVLVVGGGNAALCAAIAARRAGASVLVLEHAPKDLRGGNTRHARNLRVVGEAYDAGEFWNDLVRASAGETHENLARKMIAESADLTRWMKTSGAQIFRLSRKTAFLLGGGKALLNAYYLTAKRIGVRVCYDAPVLAVNFEGATVRDLTVRIAGAAVQLRARTVVVCSGGFSANFEWLEQYWGKAARHFVIRGTPYACGNVLKSMLDQGVAPVGNPGQCHLVAVDGRSPTFDGGIVTRMESIPFGIVVDRDGRRFCDESEIVGPQRHAIWGERIARCSGQIGYSIFDSAIQRLFHPSIYPPIRAQSIPELASKLSLDPATLVATVERFNAATQGAVPPKRRFSLPIERSPLCAYPIRPGVTFSYLGVRVDERARVLMSGGRPATNVFAAGLAMMANILGQGYLAGLGMTIGTVFGRIAGREAAAHALR